MLLEHAGNDTASGKKVGGNKLFLVEFCLYEFNFLLNVPDEDAFVSYVCDYLGRKEVVVFRHAVQYRDKTEKKQFYMSEGTDPSEPNENMSEGTDP